MADNPDFEKKLHDEMSKVIGDFRGNLPPTMVPNEIVVAMEAGGVHTLSQLSSHFRPIGIFAARSGRILTLTRDFGRVSSREFDVRHVTSVDYKPGFKSDELRVSVAGDVFTYYYVKPRGAGAAFQLYVSKLQRQSDQANSAARPPSQTFQVPSRGASPPMAPSVADSSGAPEQRLRIEMFVAAADMARGMLVHDDVEVVLRDLEPSYIELPELTLRGARVTYLLLRDRPFEEASKLIIDAIPLVISQVESEIPELWQSLLEQAKGPSVSLERAAAVSADLVVCMALVSVAQSEYRDVFAEGGSFEDIRARVRRLYQS